MTSKSSKFRFGWLAGALTAGVEESGGFIIAVAGAAKELANESKAVGATVVVGDEAVAVGTGPALA
jgi:hypothetical protein